MTRRNKSKKREQQVQETQSRKGLGLYEEHREASEAKIERSRGWKPELR